MWVKMRSSWGKVTPNLIWPVSFVKGGNVNTGMHRQNVKWRWRQRLTIRGMAKTGTTTASWEGPGTLTASRRSQPDDEFRLRASVGWATKFMGHCPHGLGELVQRGLERRERQGFSWSPINYKMSMEHLRGGFKWVADIKVCSSTEVQTRDLFCGLLDLYY